MWHYHLCDTIKYHIRCTTTCYYPLLQWVASERDHPGPLLASWPNKLRILYQMFIYSYLIAAAASRLLLPIEYMIGFGVPESGNTNSLASHVGWWTWASQMQGNLSWRMHRQSKSYMAGYTMNMMSEWPGPSLSALLGSKNAEDGPLLTDRHVECMWDILHNRVKLQASGMLSIMRFRRIYGGCLTCITTGKKQTIATCTNW